MITAPRACFRHPESRLLPDKRVGSYARHPSEDFEGLQPALAAEEGQPDRQLCRRGQGVARLEEEKTLQLSYGTIIFPGLEQGLGEGEEGRGMMFGSRWRRGGG
jgi:hypothetical protein